MDVDRMLQEEAPLGTKEDPSQQQQQGIIFSATFLTFSATFYIYLSFSIKFDKTT